MGTRFALESDRGSSSIPVRPALIGAVTGVAGILAAFTFSHGVSDAASHPERFGQTFQLTAFLGVNGQDFVPADELLAGLRANADVIGVEAARAGVATGTGGNSSVTLYSYPTGPKPLRVVITDGRMPQTADEVLLAPQSLVALHTAVGRRVVLRGAKGTAMFQVTGSGFIPIGLDNTYADGGWVTDGGYDSLFKSFKFHIALVSLRPSAYTPDAGARLAAALVKADPGLASPAFDTRSFATPAPPTEVAELRQVRVLPIILGCFLALLAIGAVGHAVATAARRRARDLAVLRALGMTQRQCRGVVLTQASVLTAVGLVFGVPLGVALGRTAWRVGANYTPVQYISPTAIWALALVAPAGLLATNLLAALVGHRAARRQVAHILRTE
ncbi:MAG: FtsX-like permease family protein [Jatrophihabitantaceae bacterium]